MVNGSHPTSIPQYTKNEHKYIFFKKKSVFSNIHISVFICMYTIKIMNISKYFMYHTYIYMYNYISTEIALLHYSQLLKQKQVSH